MRKILSKANKNQDLNTRTTTTKPMSKKKMETLTAMLHKEENMYVAECPEVGTVSQGSTADEAVENLKEATEIYLEEFPLKDKKRTWVTTFEVALNANS